MSDEPFIERIFDSGEDHVVVRFYRPSLASGGEHQCRWEIAWADRVQQRYACGVDGVQALMLAMKSVQSELMGSDLYKAGKLTYVDQYDLDLPPGWGDGQLYVPFHRNGS